LLAVIGPNWLGKSVEQGDKRLSRSDDLVRQEIESALQRDIQVIPILVNGAAMPSATELPTELKALTRRQAVEITHKRFKQDMNILINTLERTSSAWSLRNRG
jgi:hypothetical protein